MYSTASFNDLYVFNPKNATWTQLLGFSGSSPPPLAWMGFAATPEGQLYIFGGMGSVAGKLFMNCGKCLRGGIMSVVECAASDIQTAETVIS